MGSVFNFCDPDFCSCLRDEVDSFFRSDFRLKWSDDIVKKVEWSDPKMLETIDGWMREMAL